MGDLHRAAEPADRLPRSGAPRRPAGRLRVHLPAFRVRRGELLCAQRGPTPAGGDLHPEGEDARQAVNEWIRTGGAFDAVLDFDAGWRVPDRPSRIREDLHAGDHPHGNEAGYEALAGSIDLSLFG